MSFVADRRPDMDSVLRYITAGSALLVVSSLTERHYHFINDPKNWTEAQSYCRDKYTDLVTVNNADVLTTLNKMAVRSLMGSSTNAWIGLYYDVFSWRLASRYADFYKNDKPNFTNWDVGEPSNVWYLAGCVVVYSTGKWHDTYCEYTYSPVCSNGTGQNITYVFINRLMTWLQAQSYCREHMTDLAAPRNLSENEKIRAVIPAGIFAWVGLYQSGWKWSDPYGPMYVFHLWMGGQPDYLTEKCVAAFFDRSGYWGNWQCDLKRPFICQHDLTPFTRQVVKIKLVGNSAVDLNDPAVLKHLQEQLQQKVKEKAEAAEVKLSWNKRPDRKIFYTEEKQTNQK